jgi:nucleoside-diphosphate-sugar epimerase
LPEPCLPAGRLSKAYLKFLGNPCATAKALAARGRLSASWRIAQGISTEALKYMKFKTILVTGGGGYVGAVLIPKLLKAGYSVKVIDWFIYGENVFSGADETHLIRIKGDIRDKKLMTQALTGVDAVIHLACISNDPSFELDPKLGKSINYDATIQLADLSKKSGVRQFVYASTSSVYGVKKELRVTEKLPLEPLTDYSKYKSWCEKYLLPLNGKDFTVLVLRPATVCGYSPRLRLDLTVNMLTIQALVNKKITVFGGSQARPNIHIEDMTDLYVKTLSYPKAKIAGKIFNAGYENYTVSEIAGMVKKTLGAKDITIVTTPSNDLRSYRIDSTKIKRDLGFVPKHTVEEAISDLKKAYESGKIPQPLTQDRYYNIKTMKAFRMT